MLNGFTVEDEDFIGMGAILLAQIVLRKNDVVVVGSLVTQNDRIPYANVTSLLLHHRMKDTLKWYNLCYYCANFFILGGYCNCKKTQISIVTSPNVK